MGFFLPALAIIGPQQNYGDLDYIYRKLKKRFNKMTGKIEPQDDEQKKRVISRSPGASSSLVHSLDSSHLPTVVSSHVPVVTSSEAP